MRRRPSVSRAPRTVLAVLWAVAVAAAIFLGSLAANVLASEIGIQTNSYVWVWWSLLLLACLITIGGAGWATWRQFRPSFSAIEWPAGCDYLDAREFKKLPAATNGSDDNMYGHVGQTSWEHIMAAQDVRRPLIGRLMQAVLANPHHQGMRFQLICAQAGSGKTTFLFRLAYELMQTGYSVLLNLDNSPVDIDALQAACQAAAMVGKKHHKSVYLLLDNIFPVHRSLLQRLHTRPISNLTIIATSRFDVIPADAPRLHSAVLDQSTVELGDLTPSEANELVAKVQRYGLLRATDIQPILNSATEGSEPLLDVVLALTQDRGVEAYVQQRLTTMNGGEDPGWQRRVERLPRVQLYEAIARNHSWGLDTPFELLPTLSGLELSQVRLSPDDSWTREYLRPTREGRWRTEHELIARKVVAYLDGPGADPIAHLTTSLTALAPLVDDPTRSPLVATFVGQLLLRATQGPLPWDTIPIDGSISPQSSTTSRTAPLPRLSSALPRDLIARFHAFAAPAELVDLFTPAYLTLGYWDEANAAASRAITQLVRSPNQQDMARLQRARSLQQLGESQSALADLNVILTKTPVDPDALRQRAVAYVDLGDLTSAYADFKKALTLRPNDPDILLNRAIVYYGQGQYADALADLEVAFAARGNEDDPDLLNTRGLVFAGMGEVEKAMADYNRALELRPDDPDILCNRANLSFNIDNYDQALTDYSAALALSPDNPDILFSRGNVYHTLGRYAPALGDYNAALASAPDDVLTLLARAEIYAELGHSAAFGDLACAESVEPSNTEIQILRRRFEASSLWTLGEYNTPLQSDPDNLKALLHRAEACITLALYSEALGDLNRLHLLYPANYGILMDRGITYANMDRHQEALADFNRSLELDLDQPRILANRGCTYKEMGRYEEALADFNRSLELDPDNPWILTSRGMTYTNMDRHQEALADFNRSLELDPDNPWILTNRGSTYVGMRRYEEALADLNRSLQFRPDHPITLMDRGIIYAKMGRYEEALADLNRSLELNPDDPISLAARGSTYDDMGRYEEALADFNRGLELNPDDPWMLTNRGMTYYKMKRHQEALEDYNRSLELDPDGPISLAARGIIYAKMGRYEEAFKDLNRSLELDPDDPITLTNRGIAYATIGRDKEARADFERSLQLDPTLATASWARKQLLAQKPPPSKTWDQETLG